jgi:ABC-type amino acid transport system permease subunit
MPWSATVVCKVLCYLVPQQNPLPPPLHSPVQYTIDFARAVWVTVAFVCVSCWLAVLIGSACALSSLVKCLIEAFVYTLLVLLTYLFSLPLNLENSLHI